MHRPFAGFRLAGVIAALCLLTGCAQARATANEPVYVHMNGANDFLEPIVAVRPGEPVVFVNQDTGMHTIVGYDPLTGARDSAIDGVVAGTPGPGHPLPTYTVRLAKPGVYAYYCSVHAILFKAFGHAVQPAHRPGADGLGSMAGYIIVTTDPALPKSNPPTSRERIVPGYFGG